MFATKERSVEQEICAIFAELTSDIHAADNIDQMLPRVEVLFLYTYQKKTDTLFSSMSRAMLGKSFRYWQGIRRETKYFCCQALEMAGIKEDEPNDLHSGAVYMRNPYDGNKVNGILLENAGNMIFEKAFDPKKSPDLPNCAYEGLMVAL